MEKIKAYVDYNEREKNHYYQIFDVVEVIPEKFYNDEEIIEIKEVRLDAEQGNDEVYKYDFFEITTIDDEKEESYYYICKMNVEYVLDEYIGYIQEKIYNKYYVNEYEDFDEFYSNFYQKLEGGNINSLIELNNKYKVDVIEIMEELKIDSEIIEEVKINLKEVY